MTHDVIIDGKEYVLNTQAEHKEGDPIPFMITKRDMEHFMYVIASAEANMASLFEDDVKKDIARDLNRMRKEFQRMIDETEKRGNWK